MEEFRLVSFKTSREEVYEEKREEVRRKTHFWSFTQFPSKHLVS
jgi:hypothetical protein